MIDPKAVRIFERGDLSSVQEAIKSGRIDREKGLIKGVKLMGLDSKNGRRYRVPDPALFEGVQVRIDHHGKENGPEMPTDPSFKDVWATTQNVKVGQEGVVADLKYNPMHPMMETILWWAENTPGVAGFSPVNWGMHSQQGGETIIDILKVDSVDLVDKPATTNSFYERENDTMLDPEVMKIQESLLAKTQEVTNLTAKLVERDATVASLTTKLAESESKRLAAEGVIATAEAAKKASERRVARLALIPTDLPADVVDDKFKEAIVNAADDATATLLVETVKRAHGGPRSSASSINSVLGQDGKKAVESFDEAKKSDLFSYSKHGAV